MTGGAGFIGSLLCDVLVGFGAEVTAVDDLSTGRVKNIDHLMENPKFKLIKADVYEFKSQEKFDVILHMAGMRLLTSIWLIRLQLCRPALSAHRKGRVS